MKNFTIEEINLLSIYAEDGKQGFAENINVALPYMDEDMQEFARRTLSKVDALSEEEYTELAALAADEV